MTLLLVFALVIFFSPATKQLNIILGDSAKLSAGENCPGSFSLRTQDGTVAVAALVNGAWEAEGHYKDRVEHDTTSSVVLTGVTYNDNGLYEFFCGEEVRTVIQLRVIVPDDESAAEGEQLRLKCYFHTARTPVKSMRWSTTDGELVMELERASSGQPRDGTGFEGRNMSVSPECYSTGDLSLTLWEVTAQDARVFVCSIIGEDGEELRGDPAAVRVRVTKRNPDQTTAPTESKHPGENGMSSGCSVTIAVLSVALLVAALCWFGSRRSGPCFSYLAF